MLSFILAATVAGCGGLIADGSSTDDSPTTLADAQRLSDTLYGQINGNALQREAGEYLVWHALNSPVDECMTSAGFDFDPTFISHSVGYKASGTSGTIWLGEPHLRIISERHRGAAESSRQREAWVETPPEKESPETTESYQEALQDCDSPGGGGDAVSLAYADGVDELRGKFNSVIYAVDEDLGDPGDYMSCMEDKGFGLGGDDVEGYTAMTMYLLRKLPPPREIPAGDEPPSNAWTRFLQTEGEVLGADAGCRQAKYQEGMKILGPKLLEFQDKNAAEIGEVHANWQQMVETAKAKGWVPS